MYVVTIQYQSGTRKIICLYINLIILLSLGAFQNREEINDQKSFIAPDNIDYNAVKKDDITSEVSEDMIDEDTGYEEMDDDEITNIEQLVSKDDINYAENEPSFELNSDLGMLNGFEGMKDPLLFEDEIKDEEERFGEILDSEDINELLKDNDEDDSNEDENNDNQKRSLIADSESDILGFDLNEIEDEDQDSPEMDYLTASEVSKDEPSENLNQKNLNYDKLLSEFDDNKEDLGFFEANKFLRDYIPEKQPENKELDSDFLDNIEDSVSDLVTEQLSDNDDESSENEKEQYNSFIINEVDDAENEENDDDQICEIENNKKSFIEYEDFTTDLDETRVTIPESRDDDLVDEPTINFDCTDCVDMNLNEVFDDDNEEMNSKLTCPSMEPDDSDVQEIFAKNFIMKANQTNTSKYFVNITCKVGNLKFLALIKILTIYATIDVLDLKRLQFKMILYLNYQERGYGELLIGK
ncbi:hypothetical protein MXB_2657 [Myxobolus squamalis]|nr:hypothetical protein MXB_2657 [Myxobolus squamalis]